MGIYTVTYTGRNHPTNIDGVAAGLRVCRDEEYFQFFLPLVSGPDLATTYDSSYPRDQWWQALVQLGISEIQSTISTADFEPKTNPIEGIHIAISSTKIEQHLESGEPLPELKEEPFAGHEISSFDGP